LPIIRAKIPDIHFYIVGKGSTEVFKEIRNQNITITGKLESVLPYLCNADVTIVPLWFESGTRFKILEAGACTKAVVSTSLGAEGLPVTNEKDILIADDIHLFADAVVQLVKNKVFANEISDNLNLLVRTNYSIKALEIEAMKILDYLMSN
jgi:polysaccharide biosynthesis protein PslH